LGCGFIEGGKLYPTTVGVPQGGIISPVIGNMVLDGLEAIICGTYSYKRKNGINFVRYADDFIVSAKSKDVLVNEIRPVINTFLQPRGVQLSESKTKVTHISKGFDFLGQTIRKYRRQNNRLVKLQIEPSKSAVRSIKGKIIAICKSSGQLTQSELIDRLNPVVRGWANYHRHIICGKTYAQLSSFVWFRLMRWGKRRHPEKTGPWVAKRYFSTAANSTWTFKDKKTGKRLIRLNYDIQTYRHIKIHGDANPFDIEWQGYFQNREKLIKMKAVGNYIGKVLKQQDGKCLHCLQLIQAEDTHHLHTVDGDKTNKGLKNVLLLHKACKKGFEYIKRRHVTGASIEMDVSNA
jgi:RNA-directed DNA polymerase